MGFLAPEKGQGWVEFALIVILIIIVILVIGRLFGPSILQAVDSLLQTPTPTFVPLTPTPETLFIVLTV